MKDITARACTQEELFFLSLPICALLGFIGGGHARAQRNRCNWRELCGFFVRPAERERVHSGDYRGCRTLAERGEQLVSGRVKVAG